MANSSTWPIQNHDTTLLCNSSMFLMLSAVYIDGDRNYPAKTITCKEYGRTPYSRPIHIEAELRMIGTEARIVTANLDKRHK
jgi:hypothetical protein